MNPVKELQHSLSQLIYSITDLKSLNKIKSTVDTFLNPAEENQDALPWQEATLSMKKTIPFEEVVENQGDKKLTFKELYPYIDDAEGTYSIDDLLAALN